MLRNVKLAENDDLEASDDILQFGCFWRRDGVKFRLSPRELQNVALIISTAKPTENDDLLSSEAILQTAGFGWR